jgi:outer membrane lipase/esterase
MPRIRHLTAAVVLGLAAHAAQAQEFSNVISFGDSLSDAGQYPNFGFGAGSFTTNPDDVWTQLLANYYGYTQTPSLSGGTDYAFGGAPTDNNVTGVPVPLQCVPASLPCRAVDVQLGNYFASSGGVADPNALYTYWAGANDIFNYLGYAQAGIITGAQVQAYTGASAQTAVGQIGALQAAGANYIVVLNLPDIGQTPAFRGTPSQGSVTGLILIYNATLNAGLAQLGDGIIPVNAFGLVNEVLANPAAYGFTNVTGTACNLALTGGSSLFCTPGAYVTPDANETYFFADGVHPTGAAHRILAQAVVAEIAAPGQVSMLGEAELNASADHIEAVRAQLFSGHDRDRADDSVRGFADIKFSNTDFDASGWSPEARFHQATLTLGGDLRRNENWRWGGTVSVSAQRMDIGPSDVDGTGVIGTLYGAWDFAHGYINANLFLGTDSFDIDRHIQLGAMDRVETGTTSASNKGATIGGALVFGGDSVKHGPFIDVTWQQIGVDGFAEDNTDSTSMYFDDYDRDSLISRIGYQLEVGSGRVRPYGRIAYNNESEDDQVFVGAGSNSMNGHFTMPGFIPTDNWLTAELGVAFQVSDRTTAHVSYSGLFSNDIQDQNALNLGVRHDFGTTAAPVEPEEPAPAPDCSSLDDDGDGVNNCDDRCPNSPAGEGVGPDGCPVPAAPVEEPKPVRG